MGKLYIQNKSENGEVIELLALDGVHVMGTLKPGQYVEVNSRPGTNLTPFIARQYDPARKQ